MVLPAHPAILVHFLGQVHLVADRAELGGAVERLRELRPREGEEPEALVLAAADPAQPYGAALPWPKLGLTLVRASRAHASTDQGNGQAR